MKESTTDAHIIEQRSLERVKRILLDLGTSRFGPPSDSVKASIQEVRDRHQLIRMGMWLYAAISWDELLQLL